jgi:hypothetical protein
MTAAVPPTSAWDCAHLEGVLSDYLEGELAPAERAAADRHLAGCAACAALVADLQAITTQAAALPPVAPARDLWAGIEARLDTPVVSLADRTAARSTGPAARPGAAARHHTFSTRRLAAAAAALMLATSASTWWMARGGTTDGGSPAPVATAEPPQATAVQVATTDPSEATPAPRPQPSAPASRIPQPASRFVAAAVPAAATETAYDRDVDALRALVQQRRTELDSATVAVLERNLSIIDAAIAESRAALAREPRSPVVGDQLQRALARKVDLLRTIATLPRA